MSHIATEPFLLSIFITMSDDKTKSQQRIWDCNKFHFLPNLSVSNSCWLTMLVGILCNVSPICQSLRSAHSMDSTGNGCSRSKVLRNLHVVRHQVPHLSKKVYDCIARAISVLKDAPNKKRGNMGIPPSPPCSPFCGSFSCKKNSGIWENPPPLFWQNSHIFLMGSI